MIAHPNHCEYCQLVNTSTDHWYWQKHVKSITHGGYWKCKQQNRDNVKRWRKDSFAQARLTSYRQTDKRYDLECTLSLEEIDGLLSQPCYYCGMKHSDGLDRMNNSCGHTIGNVVPCCEKCNMLLSDLPFEAKRLLVPGLKQIRSRGIFDQWEVPCRRKKCN